MKVRREKNEENEHYIFLVIAIRTIYILVFLNTDYILDYSLNLLFCLIYMYIYIKELFFINRNKNGNLKVMNSKYIITGITCTMFVSTTIEVAFDLPSIYVALAALNCAYIGIILHNDIIISDNEVLYRNTIIDLTSIREINVINEKRDYSIIEIEYKNRKKRLSLKTQYLDLLNYSTFPGQISENK